MLALGSKGPQYLYGIKRGVVVVVVEVVWEAHIDDPRSFLLLAVSTVVVKSFPV